MPEVKPFQVFGIDKGIGDTETTFQVGFNSHEEAEAYLEMMQSLGLVTALEIREVKACPRCGANMVRRRVVAWDEKAKYVWDCPSCFHVEQEVQEVKP